MLIREFVDEGLGHSSYLIDTGDGCSVLVDPPRFPVEHEETAGRLNAPVRWTFDSHSHADYVTGSPGVSERLGATFVAPVSGLTVPHHGVVDGDRVDVGGGYFMEAVATPGHTPDHHAYLLCWHGDPVAVFSGGSLMVETIGRTDLCGPLLTEPLARLMFRSLRDRLMVLPDDLPVYPTHGAGSFCGAPGSAARTTTIGRERAQNPLLAITVEDDFVTALIGGFGTFPAHFTRLPELNRTGPQMYTKIPELSRMTGEQVRGHVATGGMVIDARPIAEFSTAHLPGSISNALRPVFGTWLGWIVDPDQRLVFILNAEQDRSELVRQCLDVGVENLLGELDGGIGAWQATGHPVSQIALVDSIASGDSVVDVRQAAEYAKGHASGAVNIELGALTKSAPAVAMDSGSVTMMCGHGERAMTAASLVVAGGHTKASVFNGGPETWAGSTGSRLQVDP